MIVFFYLRNDIITQTLDDYPLRYVNTRHHFRRPNYLSLSEFIDAFIYPINDYLEERSHLFILFRNSATTIRQTVLNLRGGTPSEIFPSPTDPALIDDPMWALTAERSLELVEEAASYDVPVLYVLLPYKGWIDEAWFERSALSHERDPAHNDPTQPARLISAEFDARGISYIDVTDAFHEAHLAGEGDLYGDVDTHLAPEGHDLVAHTILPYILEQLTND